MNINSIRHSGLHHACTLHLDAGKGCQIRREWHKGFPKKHEGIVYFIVVDGDIVKIGGSSCTINKLVGQYLINLESKADPKENRFCIHLMMLEQLRAGHWVDFYFIPVSDMTTYCEGLDGEMLTAIHREFRIVESRLIEQFKSITGAAPIWNNSEGRYGWDERLLLLFDERLLLLKTNHFPWFKY